MQSKLFDIFIQTIGMKRANGLGVFGFLKFKHASILVKTGCGLRVAGDRRIEHGAECIGLSLIIGVRGQKTEGRGQKSEVGIRPPAHRGIRLRPGGKAEK